MKKMSVLFAALLAAIGGQALAQNITYPTKNIEVVIPKGAGGPTDTATRTLIEFAKNKMPKGIIFVPDNKPAGNGVAGLLDVAKSKPDGYKLVMTTVELAMFPHEGKSPVTYADFTPIVAASPWHWLPLPPCGARACRWPRRKVRPRKWSSATRTWCCPGAMHKRPRRWKKPPATR